MFNLYYSKKKNNNNTVNCYVTCIWIPSLKWQQLVEYSTDIIDRLYQTIVKMGPVGVRAPSVHSKLLDYCGGGYGIFLNQYVHRSWEYSGFHQY